MRLDPAIVSAFTPTGTLRAAINLGNPVLAGIDAAGQPRGVSVDLARAFAQRLGVGIELVAFDTAGHSVEAVSGERADVGFFAVDPLRGVDIAFTAPYVLIEGSYLVPDASPIRRNEDVDREGHRIAVGAGSAYDLYLSREMKHAQIVREATAPAAIAAFVDRRLDVVAGVKQQLESEMRRLPGVRMLEGRFMVIRQAMGVPRSRGEAAAHCLADFVEAMKAGGFVADALLRHGIEGASVAPAGG